MRIEGAWDPSGSIPITSQVAMEACRKQPSKYICCFWCGTYLDTSIPVPAAGQSPGQVSSLARSRHPQRPPGAIPIDKQQTSWLSEASHSEMAVVSRLMHPALATCAILPSLAKSTRSGWNMKRFLSGSLALASLAVPHGALGQTPQKAVNANTSPPDCTRHMNYDRNEELPGYLAKRGGAKVCISFLATDQLINSSAEDKPSTSGVPASQPANEAGSARPRHESTARSVCHEPSVDRSPPTSATSAGSKVPRSRKR
jgi:hypothetical protein